MIPPHEITQLLAAMRAGDSDAFDRLIPLVYNELRRLARARLRNERPGHSLNTTGLVHDAYLKLAALDRIRWEDRNHFFAIASRLMRRILIDHAEKRRALKRGGGLRGQPFDEELLVSDEQSEVLVELDEFLKDLDRIHPRQCRVLEHRYFGGLGNEEIADVLGVSLRTVERDLRFAKTWLARVWNGADQTVDGGV